LQLHGFPDVHKPDVTIDFIYNYLAMSCSMPCDFA